MRCAPLALAVLALACGRASTVTPPEPGPASVDEVRPVAEAFATAMTACDKDAMEEVFDTQMLVARVAARMKLRPSERAGVKRGLREGLDLTETVCTPGDVFKLIAVEPVGDRALARYRNTGDDDGVNYVEVSFGRSPNGAVRAYDLFDYLTGEHLSGHLNRIFDAMGDDLRNISYMKGIERQMDELNRLEEAGEYAAARDVLARLPAELRGLRSVMTRDLQLAAQQGDTEYLAAIEAIGKAFPDDPGLPFVMYDAHVIRKDWDRALAAADHVEKRVGPDAYIPVMRAGVELERNRYDVAIGHSRTAIERDPELLDPYWQLVAAHLGKRSWTDAAAALETIRDRFELELSREDIATEPMYRDFLETEAAAGYFRDGPAQD